MKETFDIRFFSLRTISKMDSLDLLRVSLHSSMAPDSSLRVPLTAQLSDDLLMSLSAEEIVEISKADWGPAVVSAVETARTYDGMPAPASKGQISGLSPEQMYKGEHLVKADKIALDEAGRPVPRSEEHTSELQSRT